MGKKKPTLSACMIVKDAEEFLPTCLDSIKDAVDEIILCVDDRTTDRTAEIGAEYGAKVSCFKWEDDFSAARNISLGYATSDWILVIDGKDEKLEVEDIPQLKGAMSGDHAAVVFEVLNETSDTGICKQYAARMFRNGIGAHYIDRVHNQLLVDGARLMPTPPIRLYHYGYNLSIEEREAKSKRTEGLLLKQLEARPDYLFAWHNLIRVYRLEERWDELLKAAEKAFDLPCTSRNKHLREMIACDVAFAFMRTGEFEKSKASLSSWMTLESKNLDGHYYMGVALVGTGDCEGAVKHYLRWLELLEKERTDPEYTSEIMDTYGCEPEVQNALGCCYAKLEQFEKAVPAFQKAYDLKPTPHSMRKLTSAMILGGAELDAKGEIFIPVPRNTTGLRILFVQSLTCIRNYKLAVAVKSLGHSVSLACGTPLSQTYKLDDDIYDEVITFASLQHLWYAVETRKYDIIHCMNEPDDLTVAMLNDRVPVIHGTHDLMSLRHKGNRAAAFMEAVANKRSDGRVYTTQLQLEHAAQAYGIDREKSIVIPNYVCKTHVPAVEERMEKLSAKDGGFHIVYEGGISGDKTHHRGYRELFAGLVRARGLHVHVYPVTENIGIDAVYKDLDKIGPRLHFHKPVSPADLIRVLSQYGAGIVPFNITDDNRDFLDTCEGNKAREYWAAGIPVIACDTKGMRRVIAEEGPGIIYKTAGDILENLEKLKEMKVGDEHLHTMESVAPKLIEFYHSIIGNAERPLSVEKPEAPYMMIDGGIKYHRAEDHDFDEAQWWEPEKLREYQNELLRDMVTHCYENVLFWHREMRERDVRPSDIHTVEDLVKLPTVTKEMIRGNLRHFVAANAKDFGGYWSNTGGSTGEPLPYFVSRDQHEAVYAAIERGWRWAGWTPESKMMTITGKALGFHVTPETKLDVAEMDRHKWVKRIREYNPDGYRGIASPTAEFCRKLSENDYFVTAGALGEFKRKFVITTSEPLFPNQRRIIEKWLGPVFDEYGASDGGVSAMECGEHNGLHFASDIAIYDESEGLVTNLYNYAMPWLRYRLGDIAVVAAELACPCGRGLPRIAVFGRDSESIYDDVGIPELTVRFIGEMMADLPVRRFQVIEEQDGVTIKIVKDAGYHTSHEEQIAAWMRTRGLAANFEYVDDIPFTEAGKTRYIVKQKGPEKVEVSEVKEKPAEPVVAASVSDALMKSAFESGIWDAKHCRWHKALNLSTGEPDKTTQYYYNLVNLYALGKLPKGEYLSKYVAAYSWLQSRITKGMIGYTRTVPQKSDPRDQYTLALLPAVLAASELKRAEEAFEKYEQLYGMGRIHNIQASNHIILSALSLWRETGSGSYFDQALGEARWLLNRCRGFGRVFAHSAKMTEASFANHCYGAWAMAEVYKAGQELLGEEFLAELKTAQDSMEWWRAHQGKDGAFPFFLPLADKGRFDPTVYAVHQIGMFLLSAWDINRWSDGKYKDMIDKSIDCVARPEWKHTTEDGLLLYRRSTQQQDVVYAYELGWEILGLSKGGL